jgi:hypothetical protein
MRSQGVHDCLVDVEAHVIDEMNANLLRPFTMVDVETALFQIHPLISPWPDGFSACFY